MFSKTSRSSYRRNVYIQNYLNCVDKGYTGVSTLDWTAKDVNRRVIDDDGQNASDSLNGLVSVRRKGILCRIQLEEKREDAGSIDNQKNEDIEERVKRDEQWRSIMKKSEEEVEIAKNDCSEKLAYERSQRELEIQVHHRSLAAIHEELQWKFFHWCDERLEEWDCADDCTSASSSSCYILPVQMHLLQAQ